MALEQHVGTTLAELLWEVASRVIQADETDENDLISLALTLALYCGVGPSVTLSGAKEDVYTRHAWIAFSNFASTASLKNVFGSRSDLLDDLMDSLLAKDCEASEEAVAMVRVSDEMFRRGILA